MILIICSLNLFKRKTAIYKKIYTSLTRSIIGLLTIKTWQKLRLYLGMKILSSGKVLNKSSKEKSVLTEPSYDGHLEVVHTSSLMQSGIPFWDCHGNKILTCWEGRTSNLLIQIQCTTTTITIHTIKFNIYKLGQYSQLSQLHSWYCPVSVVPG